ncbi:hypothetical protein Q8F55_001319 [Vanrija albida]|uniref:Mei2-like C-terminal RNA recognition motif domain-containing protein n=1 Tax=Vanrija albida TaxID=181172 RepID=A0ABR3QFN2_9TREE
MDADRLRAAGTPLNPLSSVFQPSRNVDMSPPKTRDYGHDTTPFTPHHHGKAAHDYDSAGLFGHKAHQSRLHSNRGPSSEDVSGRYLLSATGEEVRDIVKNIASYRAIIVKLLKTKGWVIVVFHDPRLSQRVYTRLCQTPVMFKGLDARVQLQCAAIEEEVVRQLAGSGKELDQILKASESVIHVQVNGHHHGVDTDGMEKCLKRIGDLKEFKAHGLAGKSFTAEFYDTRAAAEAIRLLHNQSVEAGILRAVYRSEDPFHSEPIVPTRAATTLVPPSYTLGSAAFLNAHHPSQGSASNLVSNSLFDRYQGIFAPLDSSAPTSPYGQLTSSTMDHFSIESEPSMISPKGGEWQPWASQPDPLPTQVQGIPRQMTEPAALQGILNQMDLSARARQRQGWTAADRQAIPAENRVHPERILHGYDPRTTVMIKDVPNKLSRQELVGILQEVGAWTTLQQPNEQQVVPDEFDFVYLRFDFNNHCNVGYAFVNFTSTKALYNFIQAKVGKKWNLFSSEKVLQVSYANIQGKASLVNKFRNSAVMDVIEEWRPQIFYSSGTFKGKPADNVAIRHRAASARLSFLSGAGQPKPLEGGDKAEYDYSSAPSSSTLYGF